MPRSGPRQIYKHQKEFNLAAVRLGRVPGMQVKAVATAVRKIRVGKPSKSRPRRRITRPSATSSTAARYRSSPDFNLRDNTSKPPNRKPRISQTIQPSLKKNR
jgi:hypothetical protein